MHKKFEINRTKIKCGCQLGRKAVPHDSKSDLPLYCKQATRRKAALYANCAVAFPHLIFSLTCFAHCFAYLPHIECSAVECIVYTLQKLPR